MPPPRKSSAHFRTIVVLDFEYEVEDGDLPRVLCMVAQVYDHNFRLVRVIKQWRGDFTATPPFDIGDDALIVGYSLWAEMTCFLTLGWKFPVHVYDLHTAYLAVSNTLLPFEPDETRKKPRKRLSDACRANGIEGWEGIEKPEMARDIGEGRWQKYGKAEVFHYCGEDVENSAKLFRRQVFGYGPFAPIDVERVLCWSEYSSKAIARIQARGMPIDMPLWNLVQENKAAVVKALICRFDPSYRDGAAEKIYSLDGEWSDSRFAQWLVHAGVSAWPRLASGKIQIDGDAFRMMYPAHPALEGLHALRDAIGVVVRARIPIGRDGRNRPSLFPFGTATGRNAQSKSLYNAHASMRSFMRFPTDATAIYLDWRTQEVGVAAALSGDERLAEDYSAGDIYHGLAVMCGLTKLDAKAWKATMEGKMQRNRMKALQLGISYGMGVRSLSKGLDRHPLIGSEIILRHKRRYPKFWAWRAEQVEQAMLTRAMESTFDGWPLYLSTSPNKRTLYNFPMQSGGAAMLRLAAVRLCEADLVPNMLVHDGILVEVPTEEHAEQVKAIMSKAGTRVCNGLEIGVDVDQWLRNGERYKDKRPLAGSMWSTIMEVLCEIGALPKTGNAK